MNATKKKTPIARITTGVRNLDALLNGGFPKGSTTIVGGTPGAGKTTLVQQICFHHASPRQRVLYFNTLSEPTAKSLRYMSQFAFFDRTRLTSGIEFVDLGLIVRNQGVDEVSRLIMDHLKRVKPTIVVIDSFKVFEDLTTSREELRKFTYELAVNLMAWEATTFLIGEYGAREIQNNPLFSIVDGLVMATQRIESGEQQRFLQIVKMRGTPHSRDEHPFVIGRDGVAVFAPRVTIRREARGPSGPRCKTGISKLDELLGEGIPLGSSLLIAGVAGTGKTMLSLEFVYRGAQRGEKGIVFSFEETEERLRASARGLGWDIDREIERGMIEIVFIPQPEIQVEAHLEMMRERIDALGAKRVALDSVSVFLHKVVSPQVAREKTFQIASLVQNAQAVGFLATDIPYGQDLISRFGVEETVVDGVIVLSSTSEGLERQRYLEVYKLRNTAHLKGRHDMLIGEGGITVFPRYDASASAPPTAAGTGKKKAARVSTGVPGLDPLLGGGLLAGSATFVAGSAGIGKSTLGMQFLLEGSRSKEPGLFVSLEESPAQLRAMAKSLDLALDSAVDEGLVDIVYLARERVRPNQVLAMLTDKIREQKTRRLVLDGASHLLSELAAPSEHRQLVDGLVSRFKELGVTGVLTFETHVLQATGTVTDRGVSPIADNLVMLRYREGESGLAPTVTVVKTRGSAHDFKTHDLTMGPGGLRIGPARQPVAGTPKATKKPKRRRPAR
jgi:circadian clock protein KaiC